MPGTETFAVGTVLTFLGYGELDEGQVEIFDAGARVVVTGWNEEHECYSLRAEDDETQVDSAFPEEVEAIAEEAPVEEEKPKRSRAKPAAKKPAAAKAAAAKKPAAAKPAAKKPAAKKPAAAKADAKPAAKKPAAAKATVSGGLVVLGTIKDYVADENTAVASALQLAKSVTDSTEQVEQTKFALGGVLAYVKANEIYKSEGFENVEGFCEDRLGLKVRSCQYYIATYTSLTEAGVTEKEIEGIGMTKLRSLVGVITKENKRDLLGVAKKKTRDDLVAHVKEVKAGVGSASPSSGAATMTKFPGFKLHTDRGAQLEAAINEAKEAFGTDNMAEALAYMAQEWSQSRSDEVPMDDALAMFNAKYATDIQIEDDGLASGGLIAADDAADAHDTEEANADA